MTKKSPLALIILDGFGYRKDPEFNAILQAHTPFFNKLLESYPWTVLKSSGLAVGLPEGFAGNSEVGHLTIGSGSVILQPFTMIHLAIQDGSFFRNLILKKNLEIIKKSKKTVHLMGLLSDAGIHSHIENLFAFLKTAQQEGLTDVVIHPFLDGRDTSPQSAAVYLQALEQECQRMGIGRIGTIHGRFFAMDRNGATELTEESFKTLTEKQPVNVADWQDALDKSYQKNITDEFIKPVQLDSSALIKPHDGIIFFNFRPDRARQLTQRFIEGVPQKNIQPFPLTFFITPVSYGKEYHTTVLFQKSKIQQTLTNVLYHKGYSLFSIAETEKFAHVTYFFNGGREKKLEHETRILVPSLEHKDYIQRPEMSAETITEAVIFSLEYNPRDFYVINYANADMVGHTGNFESTVKAIECLDKQLEKLYEEFVIKRNGTLYITGDHGNAEEMFDYELGQQKTSHTTNPVYFVMARQDLKNSNEELPLTELSDIAPFIVHNTEE
ncbi:2,3-bisphosphoglycerate-independent phosphoglycerate mutase [Candidatus Babeliales bacterium]|nr:2,3-bisphosphoglycerate-independent phosphoglycerate mutase [Candidatus Babeliales bacterium]